MINIWNHVMRSAHRNREFVSLFLWFGLGICITCGDGFFKQDSVIETDWKLKCCHESITLLYIISKPYISNKVHSRPYGFDQEQTD